MFHVYYYFSVWQIFFVAQLDGREQSIGVNGGTMRSLNTPKLQPDTTYTFQVAAINGNGVGDRSNAMQIRTDFGGM